MSAILESLLDDERRAECRANDGAIAMGRPIIASRPTRKPVHFPVLRAALRDLLPVAAVHGGLDGPNRRTFSDSP